MLIQCALPSRGGTWAGDEYDPARFAVEVGVGACDMEGFAGSHPIASRGRTRFFCFSAIRHEEISQATFLLNLRCVGR